MELSTKSPEMATAQESLASDRKNTADEESKQGKKKVFRPLARQSAPINIETLGEFLGEIGHDDKQV